MKEFELNGIRYKVVKDIKDGFSLEDLKEKATDYFNDYDYIVGDWAYGKLRLKGFYASENKKCKKINDIKYLDDYIKNKCAYGCRWFSVSKLVIENKK